MATSMGAVTLLAAGVTYLLTFAALEERSLAQIRQYTAERAKREEARFVTAEDNHGILRQVLLERLQRAPDPEAEAIVLRRFDELLERTADGAMRSRRELGQGTQHTTTWIHKDTELTPELRRRIVLLHDLCEQFFPAWRTRVQSLYVSGPERFNTGFDPLFPKWVWEIEADWDQSQEEWARIATASNNPTRVSKWTGVTVDPTTQVPIVTLSTPVDVGGRHLATLHHDISVEALVRENLRSESSAMSHFIFRQDGTLIAYPEKPPPSLYRAASSLPTPAVSYDAGSGSYFAISRLAGPGWIFVSTLPRSQVRQEAFESAQWVLWTSLASLVVVLLLQSVILRRQLAQPLGQLVQDIERMRRGEVARPALDRDDELGQLGRAFSRERELSELKSGFVSLVSHEVRTPLGVIQSSADILDRYGDRITAEERRRHFDTIFRSIRSLTELVERVLMLGRVEDGRIQWKPVALDLASVCAQIVDEVVSATGAVGRIALDAEAGMPEAQADPDLLRHIVGNLLSNALKYSAPSDPVELIVRRVGDDAELVVRDHGIGIPPGERDALFESFSRASNVGSRPGTGLGLMIVQRCVQTHHGRLTLESELGVGTTVTVHLPTFAAPSRASSGES